MVVTPTATSQTIAGFGFWSLIWGFLFKLDKLAKLCRCDRWVNKEAVFAWINNNKGTALIGSEVINLLMHPPENSSSTLFCLGGTLMNIFMIFVMLPFRQSAHNVKNWIFRAA